MNKFIYKLYVFMQGRNGADELHRFLLILFFLISIINIFLGNYILSIIELLLFIVIFYRFLSKNIKKRRIENKKYLSIKKSIRNKYNMIKKRWNDRNTHIYRKCPKCRTILRLPLRRGVNTCKCPKCGNRFKVRCFRNEKVKVEVIKNK